MTCTGDQQLCDDTCVEEMTDPKNCGECGNTCGTKQSCSAGHCSDMITSCADIRVVNPNATSGLYTLVDGTAVFCDIGANKEYTALSMGQFDSAPAGYTLLSSPDLVDATKAPIFIALYNKQGGLKVIANFGGGIMDNCCFKNDATTAAMMFMSGTDVYPAVAGVKACNPMGGYDPTKVYTFALMPDTASPIFATPPLPTNYFTVSHPPTASAGCLVGNNPALFWKVI